MADYAEALRTAIGLHQAGQLSQAEQIYRQVLDSFPCHPDALHLLGLVAHQSGRQEMAVQYIGQAINANPNQPGYYNSLGDAFRVLGNLASAELSYAKALELAPSNVAACNNLGKILRAQGKLEESLVPFRKALACQPNSPVTLTNLGVTLTALKRYDEAIEHLKKVVEVTGQAGEAHLNLGCAYSAAEDWDRAIACFQEAVRRAPNLADARVNLANALRVKGDLAAAATVFTEALRLHPQHVKLLLSNAAFVEAQGRAAEALQLADRALAIEPNSAAAQLQRAKALAALGRTDEAQAAQQAAAERRPPGTHTADLPLLCLNASHQHKCLFIHVPKNGGTSIKQVLDMPGAGHHTWLEYATHYPQIWQQYASFAVIRNPWDRVISAYTHAKMKESHWHNSKMGLHPDYRLLHDKSFAECVTILAREPGKLKHESWWDQSQFVLDTKSPDKKIMAGTLLRFESLNADFNEFCQARNIQCQRLPTVNTSDRDRDYRKYFTDELRQMVEDVYRDDVDKFGYSF